MKSRQTQLIFLPFLLATQRNNKYGGRKKQEKKEKSGGYNGESRGGPPLLNTDFDTYVSKSVLSYSH